MIKAKKEAKPVVKTVPKPKAPAPVNTDVMSPKERREHALQEHLKKNG